MARRTRGIVTTRPNDGFDETPFNPKPPDVTFGRGATCRFYAIDGIGYKFYSSDHTRDKCFELQQHAAKYGLAPKPYSKFKVKNSDEYGMTTQLATNVGEDAAGEQRNRMTAKLRKIGLHPNDLHAANLGKVGSKWVCIDFSHFGDGIDEDQARRYEEAHPPPAPPAPVEPPAQAQDQNVT